ncbi:pectate lyase superfamily protein-domain-containing protein [Xylaria sp. FL0064]|nr:pectate lyase superfamily protein-domain-containing protein [Xylaria sp. FL0064]
MATRSGTHILLLLLLLQYTYVAAHWKYADPKIYPHLPDYGPQPNPPYMVDNTKNYYHVAPDKGKQNGPVWAYSGSLNKYLANLRAGRVIRGGFKNQTAPVETSFAPPKNTKRQDSSYWLEELAPMGSAPLAGGGYKFFRNVKDYGADDSGGSDAAEAINAAISDGDRCGEECGNTFTKGAIVYFPPGKYMVCTPIIQLYYTQFIGDALDPPTIIGCPTFKGIALIDTDPYIPGGSGAEWFVNQNQFFRHIRNFVFDLTEMPNETDDNDQPLVPTGIHWQVAQATTLQNLVFTMPSSSSNTTAVGIFTENGSGGFVSDLTFNGGNIGWRAGSQQYTARNLKFSGCLTAIQMVWDWGWTWQGIDIEGGAIGFNISGVGGSTGQGTGSVSIIDTTISNVPVGILTNAKSTSPDIVLDNVVANGVAQMVQVDGGATLLGSVSTIDLWATGKVYNGSKGATETGPADAPAKASSLLSDGKLFTQSRPQYETYSASQFYVATRDGGCANDGTGDQKDCINAFLQHAVSSQLIAYFPAGIYTVGGTVVIPTGSRIQGSSWSQIQGSGYFFSDMTSPKVMVQVGNPGDIGTMEIVEMLFSVRGNTAGAILMEWNVAASSQGAAAMWDSHFRVGGGTGTDLDIKNCPKHGFNDQCIAASLMFHVTKEATGYFENVWAWVADHDNDESLYNNPDTTANQISIYGARGMLIESQGPSWFYGTGSEHSVMYNYQLSGAKNIFMGHIQTETPYYQPEPIAPAPFNVAKSFPNDPDFSGCEGDTACAAAWGMRVVDSSSITIHGAGLYSFFQDYYQDCVDTHDCQERILEVTGSTDVVVFNLYTVATSKIAMGIDNTAVFQNDSNQRGFTTEDSIWLPFDGADNIDTVFVGTPVWTTSTVTCAATSCLLVLPTSPLSSSATISPEPYTTSFQYGGPSTVTSNGVVTVTFITSITTTVLQIPPVTIGGLPFSNYNISSGQTVITASPSVSLPSVTISLPDGSGHLTPRVVPLPPWPLIDGGSGVLSMPTGTSGGSSETFYTGITSTVTVRSATVTTVSFPASIPASTITCPPQSEIVFATPDVTIMTDCPTPTTWAIGFNCPSTKVVTFLGPTTGLVSVDCSLVTLFTSEPTSTDVTSPPGSSTTTPLPVWTTWPPGQIEPVTTTVSKPEPTDRGSKQPCTLWFFFICISHGDLHIGGWYFPFPPGIYPPGPPPSIDWPPGFTLEGTLPPWPEITIGPDNQLTYEEEPSSSCTTKTADVCSTTTSIFVTSSGSSSSTTSVTTITDCETVTGCSASYSNTHSQTTIVSTCTECPTCVANKRRAFAEPTEMPKPPLESPQAPHVDVEEEHFPIRRRAGDCTDVGYVVYPKDPKNVASIIADLQEDFNDRIWSRNLGYTAYFWVLSLPPETYQKLRNNPDVLSMYDYHEWNLNNPNPPMNIFDGIEAGPMLPIISARDEPLGSHPRRYLSGNMSHIIDPEIGKTIVSKREHTSSQSLYFNTALISVPPGQRWKGGARGGGGNAGNPFIYNYDDSAGSGISVYGIGEVYVWTGHPEFSGRSAPRELSPQSRYGSLAAPNDIAAQHGTFVLADAGGAMLGVCKKCDIVYSGHGLMQDDSYSVRDWWLEDLLSAWDDMNEDGRTPAKSVINLSWGSQPNFWTPVFILRLYEILSMMVNAGVTVVMSAGNAGITPDPVTGQPRTNVDTYPQMFARPPTASNPNQYYIPNLILVGASDQYGKKAMFSQEASYITTYAAGKNIYGTTETGYEASSGTSFAAPQVAALAAYFKALPSVWQDQLNQASSAGPAAVKALIVAYQRNIVPSPMISLANTPTVKLIWNGMDQTTNCLLDYPNGGDPKNACPNVGKDPTTYMPPPDCAGTAIVASPAMFMSGNDTLLERQSGESCTLPADGGGGGAITVGTGPSVGPTCVPSTACGGVLCTGYWCAPTPTGYPPGFQDPKDPSSSGNTPSQTSVTQGFPPGSSSPTTSPTISPPTSSPTPTQSITPLTRGPINCFNEDDFPGHGDISPSAQDEFSQAFSDEDTEVDTIGPDTPGVTLHGTDEHGINYDYSAEWVDGCVTTVPEQSFGFPLGSPSLITAYLLVREDYTKCDNGGVGGSCQVGCLVYTFKGALGDQGGRANFTDGPQGRRNFTTSNQQGNRTLSVGSLMVALPLED